MERSMSLKEELLLYISPREGSRHAIQSPRGRARFWSGNKRQVMGGSWGQGLYGGFHGKDRTGQSDQLVMGACE